MPPAPGRAGSPRDGFETHVPEATAAIACGMNFRRVIMRRMFGGWGVISKLEMTSRFGSVATGGVIKEVIITLDEE